MGVRHWTLIFSLFLLLMGSSNSFSNDKIAAPVASLPPDSPEEKSPQASQSLPPVKKGVIYKKHYSAKPLDNPDLVKWSHAPYLEGVCDTCHVTNNPKNPGKLKGPVNDQCLGCHELTKHTLKGFENTHRPTVEDCSYCHNAHNAKTRMLLHEEPNKLCTSCHEQIATISQQSPVKHEPVNQGQACSNCHLPHAANIKPLLKGPVSDMCLGCHGKDDVKGKSGKHLQNIGRLVEENQYHHDPIDKKDCAACHNSHGSPFFRLLIKNYPESFYAPFEKDTYALCFSCHNERAIVTTGTTKYTGFRDGLKNLHKVHVKDPKRGRTCRACHGEHATPNGHLIRWSVPYGSRGWRLLVNFKETKSGGRCLDTCHGEKEYRNK